MNEYRTKIEYLLQKAGKKGQSEEDLWRRSHLNPKFRKAFHQTLAELLGEGLVRKRRGRYVWAASAEQIAATVTRLHKTFGFVEREDQSELFVPGKYLLGALPGDSVLVKIIPGHGAMPTAQILRIVKEGPAEFTGRLVQTPDGPAVEPDHLGNEPILLEGRLKGAKEGDKVLAEITRRGQSHHAHRAAVIRAYGSAQCAASCAAAILEGNGISDEFPLEVQDEALQVSRKGFAESDLWYRTDLRDEIIFTIDGADSKDLDDAVSIQKYQSGWQLGVHIADVSHYVRQGSALDQEAFYRGTSLYYADQVIPMLPAALSNGICSLNPNEDRLAFSCIMTLSPDGELEDYDFQKTIIRSRVKGVYSEVNALLAGTADEAVEEKYRTVKPKLLLMEELAKLRLKLREARGVPEIETSESKIITDEAGFAVDIVPRTRGMAEMLIEEFMLLANESAASAARQKEVPLVYRVHESPAMEKVEHLREVLSLLGVSDTPLPDRVKPGQLAQILRKAKGTPLESVLSMQVLRTMAKAKYSEAPLGHYGLALENYAHFTSPIRRYADLTVHRVLSMLVRGSDPEEVQRKFRKAVPRAARQATETELLAMQVERECEDCYKAEYMAEHVGEVFDAVLVAAVPHGLYAELPNTVEGLIRVEDLPAGEYYFDEVLSYKNLNTGERFAVGDRVQVCCTAVDVNTGRIDFTLKRGGNKA